MSKAKPSRGRPVVHTPEEQWTRVLDAFAQLLDQCDLDAHSMDDIARVAGMSKRTLYRVVPNKEALVVRLIEEKRLSATSLLDKPVESSIDARELLERFLLEWMRAAYAPTTINIIRMAMDERRAFPGIGNSYLTEGGDFITNRLKHWLREQVERGHLESEDPELVAEMLGDGLISRSLMAAAWGHQPIPTPAWMQSRVRAVLAAWHL